MMYSLFCAALMASAALAADEINFAIIGDWGGQSEKPYTTPIQLKTAKALATVAESQNVSFVIGIGDNFYDAGIQGNDHNSRFQTTFQEVYNQKSLQLPWYLMSGNHDHAGNVSAEIAYRRVDPTHRWHYPDLWYNESYRSGALSMDIFYIDTIIWADTEQCDVCHDIMGAAVALLPNNATEQDLQKFLIEVCKLIKPDAIKCEHAVETYGNLLRGILDKPKSERAGLFCQAIQACAFATRQPELPGKQKKWLEDSLSAAKADWVFVTGHFPVYSTAEHGPTKILVNELKPMLEKYHIPAYFNGHDHNLQHLEDGAIDYFVTGMGCKCDDSHAHASDVPTNSLKFYHPSKSCSSGVYGGFITVSITADQMTVRYWDQDAQNIYTRVKPKQ